MSFEAKIPNRTPIPTDPQERIRLFNSLAERIINPEELGHDGDGLFDAAMLAGEAATAMLHDTERYPLVGQFITATPKTVTKEDKGTVGWLTLTRELFTAHDLQGTLDYIAEEEDKDYPITLRGEPPEEYFAKSTRSVAAVFLKTLYGLANTPDTNAQTLIAVGFKRWIMERTANLKLLYGVANNKISRDVIPFVDSTDRVVSEIAARSIIIAVMEGLYQYGLTKPTK